MAPVNYRVNACGFSGEDGTGVTGAPVEAEGGCYSSGCGQTAYVMKIGYCYFCNYNFLGWLFDLQKVQATACALHGRYYHDVYRCYAGLQPDFRS